MKRLRLGIVGSGFMGQTHAAAAVRIPEIELIAVAGGKRAASLAQSHGVQVEPGVAELLARPDLDAVVLTTPHALHAEQGLLAFAHGKHALIEKPLATSTVDCDRLLEAAQRSGCTLAVGYHQRFRANNREARERIRSGSIGEIVSVQISMPMYWPAAAGGGGSFGGNWAWWQDPASIGHILNSGPHAVDLLRWFLAAEVEEVFAFCRTVRPASPVEDTTMALLSFGNGTIASLYSTNALSAPTFSGEDFRLRIAGTRGLLDLNPYGELRAAGPTGWQTVCEQPPVGYQDSDTAFGPARLNAYVDQLRSFLAAIQGEPADCGTGADGRAAVAVCLAMLEASAKRAVVRPS